METRYIKTAFKVAEIGSLRGTARELFMSYNMVRWEISTVEKELGFPVFYRSRCCIRNNTMTLTRKGAKWLASASKALELLEHGEVEIKPAKPVRVKRTRIRKGVSL